MAFLRKIITANKRKPAKMHTSTSQYHHVSSGLASKVVIRLSQVSTASWLGPHVPENSATTPIRTEYVREQRYCAQL